nr:hypothetical protein [Pandoravirus aubagnensis]
MLFSPSFSQNRKKNGKNEKRPPLRWEGPDQGRGSRARTYCAPVWSCFDRCNFFLWMRALARQRITRPATFFFFEISHHRSYWLSLAWLSLSCLSLFQGSSSVSGLLFGPFFLFFVSEFLFSFFFVVIRQGGKYT